jgi:hypothetical protein
MSKPTCDICGGGNIIVDCRRCGAPQCCEDCCRETTYAKIGKAWSSNSSLEKWFPFTAQELAILKAERDELRKALYGLLNSRFGTATNVLDAQRRAAEIISTTKP